MPGHIYAQSDKIQEAISAFSAAAANEQKWIASDSLYPNGHYGHNVHFLIHALNLGGRYDDSMKWVQDLFTYKENPRERNSNNQRTVWRQGYFGLIKSMVRFEKWNEIIDGKTIPVYDKPEQNAWRHWAMGLAYSATGQADKAKATLADMHKDLDAVTSAKEPIGIAAQELEATIAARAGDRKKAYELYRKAADREANILYTEPPAYPRPVVEGWGNVALALGDYATAEKAYREALEREPGSGRAFFGLAASLEGQGKNAEAQDARASAPPRRGRTPTPTCRRCRSCAPARPRWPDANSEFRIRNSEFANPLAPHGARGFFFGEVISASTRSARLRDEPRVRDADGQGSVRRSDVRAAARRRQPSGVVAWAPRGGVGSSRQSVGIELRPARGMERDLQDRRHAVGRSRRVPAEGGDPQRHGAAARANRPGRVERRSRHARAAAPEREITRPFSDDRGLRGFPDDRARDGSSRADRRLAPGHGPGGGVDGVRS